MNALERLSIFIPAFRKKSRFQGDLLTKLDGVSLVQRAIDRACLLCGSGESIYLFTDSDDIALVAKRNNIGVVRSSTLHLEGVVVDDAFREHLTILKIDSEISVLLSPYAPLLKAESVQRAINVFLKSKAQIFQPVRIENRRLFDGNDATVANSLLGDRDEIHRIESRAFKLFKPSELLQSSDQQVSVQSWDVGNDAFEIDNLQDWWVCEKLLQRKRIIFRVIGNEQVGMGHVYRSLALAHELHDHEVLFVTDTRNHVAVEAIVKRNYWLGVYPPESVIKEIIRLRPDMIINDVLDTKKKDIDKLNSVGSTTVSFEDLGSGARCTDLTINEIYDTPQFSGDHILWGQRYFFLRDEFQSARPHRFKGKVEDVMLAFGGTDQHDLARKIFFSIKPLCDELGIFVHIVTGPGYRGYDRLMREVKGSDRVSLTHGSEVISSIMEQVQLAITSNGRTVYEFAHMNIPAIVIAQHKREVTHAFASEENGFVPLGIYQEGKTEERVVDVLKNLTLNTAYRRRLFKSMSSCKFTKNKEAVVKLIQQLLA